MHEVGEALVDDGLHDTPVDVGEPDAHQRANNQQTRQQVDVPRFLPMVVREHDFYQLSYAFPEEAVDVATSAFLVGRELHPCRIQVNTHVWRGENLHSSRGQRRQSPVSSSCLFQRRRRSGPRRLRPMPP